MFGLKIAFICFLTYAVIISLIFRLIQPKRFVKTLMFGGIFSIFLYIFLYLAFTVSFSWVDFINGFIIYSSLYYYFSLSIVILNTSLTITILILLKMNQPKNLTFSEIKELYPYDSILDRRMKKLIGGKSLIEDSGYFKLTKKGAFYASIAKPLKLFFNCYPGG